MKSALLPLAALTAAFATTSCETTGNPREGGIFWSEDKANQRLDARRNHLNAVESDTRRVDRNSSATERDIGRARAERDRY